MTTRRLVLEPLRVEHAHELAPLLDDPALHAFTGGRPETEAQLRARYARQVAGASPDGAQGWLNWVLRDRHGHAALGIIQATIAAGDEGHTAELAWVIATSRQRAGLATEAATAAMDWLRLRGVTTFVAHIHPDHAASTAVARHLGLRPTEGRRGGEVRWVG
jgi:RimJ/RimL family protein N-acetyltransferase